MPSAVNSARAEIADGGADPCSVSLPSWPVMLMMPPMAWAMMS